MFLRLKFAVVVIPLLMGACTVVWPTVEVEEVAPAAVDSSGIDTPVRAYLADGSVVVLPGGAYVSDGELLGDGTRHSLALAHAESFRQVSLDSVIAMEAFDEGRQNEVASSLLAAASMGAITLVAGPALFGSCPTIYVDVEGQPQLQVEPFSFSIAPLFEARDVDRVWVPEDGSGTVRFEVRNEAVETHYINHMELLEVVHGPDQEVLSTATGEPLLLGHMRAPLGAVDRDGRDVLAPLQSRDSMAFRSSPGRLARATEADFSDFLELEIPVVPGSDAVALVLRLRNTLLNTVLFYDLMLGESGFQAVGWLGEDLARIGAATDMARWYRSRMGIRVEVEREGEFQEVDYLPDAGPIAWTERAVLVPVGPEVERARVRLRFVSDSWLIDRIAVATPTPAVDVSRYPVARVLRSGRPSGTTDTAEAARLSAPDEDYLVTFPGDLVHVEFDVAPASAGSTRTLLLATQGYYVEWVRGDWIRDAQTAERFRPRDSSIVRAMRRWQDVMEDFERDFHASRIPVR